MARARQIVLAALVAALCLWSGAALAWEAEIIRVSDGDTVVVWRVENDERVRIRLYGVDAPEGHGSKWKPQPYSRVATDFLKTLLPVGSRVTVVDMGYDKYTRTVGGIVTLPDGKVAQEELLQAGLVWVYPKYCTDCRQWKALQEEARTAQKGLWKAATPVPPWEWRHGAAQE